MHFCKHSVSALVNRNFVPQGVEGQEDSLDGSELALLVDHAQGASEVFTLVCCENGLGILGIQNANLSPVDEPCQFALSEDRRRWFHTVGTMTGGIGHSPLEHVNEDGEDVVIHPFTVQALENASVDSG
jgi:hypothetical protein